MEEEQRINITRIIGEAIKAVKNDDVKSLKNLSNETIHDASTVQDQHSIAVAVLIYTLSKIYERESHYEKFKGWRIFCLECQKVLETAKQKLESNDVEGFDLAIKKYMKHLKNVEKKLRNYIQDVLRKAKINKASRLYEHGVSLGRTADMLDITRFELMDYVGKTYIADVKESVTLNAEKRLEMARKLFK